MSLNQQSTMPYFSLSNSYFLNLFLANLEELNGLMTIEFWRQNPLSRLCLPLFDLSVKRVGIFLEPVAAVLVKWFRVLILYSGVQSTSVSWTRNCGLLWWHLSSLTCALYLLGYPFTTSSTTSVMSATQHRFIGFTGFSFDWSKSQKW